jgi:hypothetical protein
MPTPQPPDELYYDVNGNAFNVFADGSMRIIRPGEIEDGEEFWIHLSAETVFAILLLFQFPGVRPLLHREHMARQTAFHRKHVEALRGPRPESGKRRLNGR